MPAVCWDIKELYASEQAPACQQPEGGRMLGFACHRLVEMCPLLLRLEKCGEKKQRQSGGRRRQDGSFAISTARLFSLWIFSLFLWKNMFCLFKRRGRGWRLAFLFRKGDCVWFQTGFGLFPIWQGLSKTGLSHSPACLSLTQNSFLCAKYRTEEMTGLHTKTNTHRVFKMNQGMCRMGCIWWWTGRTHAHCPSLGLIGLIHVQEDTFSSVSGRWLRLATSHQNVPIIWFSNICMVGLRPDRDSE